MMNERRVGIDEIRAVCSEVFGRPFDHDFFSLDYQDGEDPDAAIIRLFCAERRYHEDDRMTILVLCNG